MTRPIPLTEETFAFPASFAQERLWLLAQIEPGNPVYHISGAVRFTGRLNVPALEASLNEIVRRQESLRTTFKAADDKVMQIVSPLAAISLEMIPADAPYGSGSRADLPDQLSAIVQKPFDLEAGPLLRAVLLRVTPEDHLLVFVIHHIVSDGWSMMVLVREFMECYESFLTGNPLSLPALPIQYADYSEWQKRWLSSGKLQTELSYWKSRLKDVPVLDLPSDYNRPPVQRHLGARQCRQLSPSLSAALIDFSKREQVTLFTVLLAAFKVLLHRYTGSQDIVVGTPVAGRKRPELERLIGCFLNTLVLRTEIPEHASFAEVLNKVREVALDAYAHDNTPFEKVLEEINPARALSHTPLFQVFLNMLTLPEPLAINLPGIAAEIVDVSEVSSKFDLTLYVHAGHGKIDFELVYNSELFVSERIAETLAQFDHLLAQVVERPHEKVSRYSLVTERAESVLPDPRVVLDSKWEGAVHELFRAHAERNPRQLAVADPHVQWNYEELERLSNQLANHLLSQGIQPGNVVAIYAHRSAPLVVALLGIMKAGGAFLVLDPAYPAARLADYLEIAQPRACLQLESAGAVPPEIEELLAAWSCPKLVLPSSVQDFDRAFDKFPSSVPAVCISADDVAYISFTSGSTGKPKGVLGRHGPLSHFVPWLVKTFALDKSDRFSLFSALSHDPLHRDVFTPLMIGATVFIPPAEDWKLPGKATEWIRKNDISVCHLTPAMGQLLSESNGKTSGLDSLRYVFFVGDALTRRDVLEIYELAPRVTCINYFGATETQRAVSFLRIPRAPKSPDGNAGLPLAKDVIPLGHGIKDVQLLVLNRERLLAGIGEAGEIYLRSPHLALGYLGDAKLSEEKFVPNWFTGATGDRLYKTGDLGRYLPDGSVETLGRADTQVKVRGFRIEPGEIEAVLKRHRLVLAATVIPWQDPSGSKQLAAYVVLDHEQTGWQHELVKFVAEKLPDYMVPAAFVGLPALPVTPNGKLDRRALPPPAFTVAEQSDHYVPARDPDEELLCGVFAQVLRRQRVGVGWNFFEMGGHSLLATQVISRIRKELSVDLPLRALFESPTVAGLARRAREARNAGRPLAPPIERADRQRDLPLSFAQQRLWFLDQLDPGNTAYNMLFGVRLNGALDKEALRRSLNEIVRRHEVLRTAFPEQNGVATQRIAQNADAEVPIEEVDLPHRADRNNDNGDQVLALCRAESEKPFDLRKGPLVRVKLIQLDDQQHVVLMTMHHIVGDAWSTDILVQELSQLYPSYHAGRPSPLAPLEIQYADYAVWQRAWLQGEVLDRQVDYWRRQLADVSLLELPTDRPRPAVMSLRGATLGVSLHAELAEQLTKLSRREGVTLFMTLLAGWQLLLARYSGQSDITVGSPIAGRTRAETSGLIGFFVNTLVLRTQISGPSSVRQLLRQVRERTLEAYEHQDVPFEKLVDELQPERDLSRQPFFQVAFGLQNTAQQELQLPGLRLSLLEHEDHARAAKFDLTLLVAESERGIQGRLEYSTDLFDRTTVETMVRRWQSVLEQMVKNPEQPLSRILLTDEAERQVLARGWSGQEVASPHEQTMGALLARQAGLQPQAPAVIAEGRELSYGELNRQANQWAHYLKKQGVTPGVRVGVCLEAAADWVVASAGVLKSGAVLVGLEPGEPPMRMATMLENSETSLVITAKHLAGNFPPDAARLLLVEESRAELAKQSEDEPHEEADANSLACIVYRASAVGSPVGVLVSHRTLWAPVFGMEPGINDSDRVAQTLGFSGDLDCLEVFRVLARGDCMVNVPGRPALTPRKFANILREQKVKVLWTSALMLEGVAREFPWALKNVRRVVCDERLGVLNWLKPTLKEEVLKRVYCVYGSSEVGGKSMMYELAGLSGQQVGMVKTEHLVPGTKLYLLDSELEPTPEGVVGEIYLAGESLAAGYDHEPALTAAAFVPNPFSDVAGARLYRTGDWARRRAGGGLEYCGRHDGRVVVDGLRIELEEIESVLAGHQAVREVAVVLREVPGKNHASLVALIAASEGQAVSDEELRSFLQERLRAAMAPQTFVRVQKLARDVEGRVDRRALMRMLEAREAAIAAPEYAAPRTEVEKVLSAIWEEVLNVAQVGVHDNFFKLGGDSILSIQVIARARQAGVELTPRLMFERQTIAELAEVAGSAARVRAEQGSVTGPAPLTPFQAVFFQWGLAKPEHFNQSLLLGLDPGTDSRLLEQAVVALLKQHDALRMRYERGQVGWRQACEADAPAGVYERRNLAGLSETEQREALEHDATAVQGSLDLAAGRLMKVVEYDLGAGRGKRLLLVIHHLVVDGVSWRILIEDMERGYQQLAKGEDVALGIKTTSFKEWAERLQQYAEEERVLQEVEYWSSGAENERPALALDYEESHENNLFGTQKSVIVRLEEEETRALLQDVPGVYHTQINDVLLTALGRALGEWGQSDAVLVDVEAHGREEIFADVDVSRTVGWFTSTYPVLLKVESDSMWEPGTALTVTKEQLRAVPNRGLGYGVLRHMSGDQRVRDRLAAMPPAEIIFNYLGQVDQVLRRSTLFASAPEGSGSSVAPGNRRPYVLDVSAIVAHSRLQVTFSYSDRLNRRETIERIANRYTDCLRELITHCRSEEAGGFTPSDFAADTMTQEEMMKIASLLDK